MPQSGKSRSAAYGVLEFIGILAAAVVVAYVLQLFVVKPFQIPSESMLPTIEVGDRILVNRLAYQYGSIDRGDIIVFESTTEPGVDVVKRVIALAGDTVEVRQGRAIVNGLPLEEPYISSTDSSNFLPQTVPEGNVFVMGDNRPNSQDGRYWHPPWLPVQNILGKAFITYWPVNRIKTL